MIGILFIIIFIMGCVIITLARDLKEIKMIDGKKATRQELIRESTRIDTSIALIKKRIKKLTREACDKIDVVNYMENKLAIEKVYDDYAEALKSVIKHERGRL